MAFLRSRVTEPPGSYKTVPSIIPCILSPHLASLGGAACCCAGGTPRHAGVCVCGAIPPLCASPPSSSCHLPSPGSAVCAVLCGAGRARGFRLTYLRFLGRSELTATQLFHMLPTANKSRLSSRNCHQASEALPEIKG